MHKGIHLRHTRRRSPSAMESLAQGLGWFSIGLGVVELAAPGTVTRALGLRGQRRLVQACGVREIATGVAILGSRNPAPWVWGRVAGDAIDIAALAATARRSRKPGAAGLALAAVAGITMLDIVCAQGLAHEQKSRLRRRRLRGRYRNRTGFPQPAEAMRGAASDFVIPEDYRVPSLLRPWPTDHPKPESEPPDEDPRLASLPGLA